MSRLALQILGVIVVMAATASAFQAGHHYPRGHNMGMPLSSSTLPSSSEAPGRSCRMGDSSRLYAAAKKKKVVAKGGETLRKKDMVNKINEMTNMPKNEVDTVISALLDSIVESVADGNKVNFVGFGSFVPRSRAARKGRNPKTGEEMEIKASNSVGFTAGKSFKDRLNE